MPTNTTLHCSTPCRLTDTAVNLTVVLVTDLLLLFAAGVLDLEELTVMLQAFLLKESRVQRPAKVT